MTITRAISERRLDEIEDILDLVSDLTGGVETVRCLATRDASHEFGLPFTPIEASLIADLVRTALTAPMETISAEQFVAMQRRDGDVVVLSADDATAVLYDASQMSEHAKAVRRLAEAVEDALEAATQVNEPSVPVEVRIDADLAARIAELLG